MTMTLADLAWHASSLNVTIHIAHLEDDVNAFYEPSEARVYMTFGLTPVRQRVALAHEFGHVFYSHDCSTPANERAADLYAARLLIDPVEYARHERINPDQHTIADELDVTVDLIYVYERHCLTRVRGVTYTHAREGVNQWAHRAEVA